MAPKKDIRKPQPVPSNFVIPKKKPEDKTKPSTSAATANPQPEVRREKRQLSDGAEDLKIIKKPKGIRNTIPKTQPSL
jgi:hypothetical protein